MGQSSHHTFPVSKGGAFFAQPLIQLALQAKPKVSLPPSNHGNKTVPDGFFCLPMASVSGMPHFHSRHANKPNRYCRKLCDGTCESLRFLLRCFHTNSNLPSAQGSLQHVKMSQLPGIHNGHPGIHGHPGAGKISEFQNSRAKNWIPEGVQYIECPVGRRPENCFFSLRYSGSNTRSEHLEPS